jgi:hypothetical protein
LFDFYLSGKHFLSILLTICRDYLLRSFIKCTLTKNQHMVTGFVVRNQNISIEKYELSIRLFNRFGDATGYPMKLSRVVGYIRMVL